MTKKHYDTASASIQNQIVFAQKAIAAANAKLENALLTQAEINALNNRIELLGERLERLSDIFDALATKYIASVKREAEAAYGRAA